MVPLTFEDNKIVIYPVSFSEPISLDVKDINDDNLRNLEKNYIDGFKSSLFKEEDIEVLVSFEEENTDLLKEIILRTRDVKLVINVKEHLDFLKFMSNFHDSDLENIYINYQRDSEYANFKEYKKMINKIYEIVDCLKSYDLSQLELITIVYDLVKSHYYKEIDKNKPHLSRSLHCVINESSFVCAGFSNYFNFILNELGMHSDSIILEYTDSSHLHQRNIVYVNDSQYNVKGIFVFDPTFDCNKNDNYLNNYKYFMQNIIYFKKINHSENIKNIVGNCDLYEIIENKDKEFEKDDIYEITKFTKTLNYINRFAELDFEKPIYFLNTNEEWVSEKIQECYNLVNCHIAYEDFMKLLYNVRKVEYELGISNKPDKKEIKKVTLDKYCNIAKVFNDKETLFYLRILFEIESFDYCFEDEDKMVKKKK